MSVTLEQLTENIDQVLASIGDEKLYWSFNKFKGQLGSGRANWDGAHEELWLIVWQATRP